MTLIPAITIILALLVIVLVARKSAARTNA